MADLIVRGGTLVTPRGLLQTDVAVEAGAIQAIGPELSGAEDEIDARGLHVFPALIDVGLQLFGRPCGDPLRVERGQQLAHRFLGLS